MDLLPKIRLRWGVYGFVTLTYSHWLHQEHAPEIATKIHSDVFPSLGIPDGSPPTSVGILVRVSIGILVGKLNPVFFSIPTDDWSLCLWPREVGE